MSELLSQVRASNLCSWPACCCGGGESSGEWRMWHFLVRFCVSSSPSFLGDFWWCFCLFTFIPLVLFRHSCLYLICFAPPCAITALLPLMFYSRRLPRRAFFFLWRVKAKIQLERDKGEAESERNAKELRERNKSGN